MNTDPSNLNPLDIADPRRQAADTIRANEYQIWQSVFRWVTLKPNEVLFLEKAEDFDVIDEKTAETAQVKDTFRSGSVTLNSASVIEAINNFWRHQQKNPNYFIRFKLLTTSARGMERSNPFNGIQGLDYWDRCKSTNSDLKPLRDFLIENAALSEDLRHYVATSSDEELRSDLISRIEWASEQLDHESVRELIKRRVVAYGIDVHSLQPAESEKVIPHLFTHVLKVIRESEDRRLDLSDFGTIFEEHTTRRLTPQEIQGIKSLARSGKPDRHAEEHPSTQIIQHFHGSVGAVQNAPHSTANVTEVRPEESVESLYDFALLDSMVKRDDLVFDLRARLSLKNLLVLKGSSGMGKSTLAILLVSKDYGKWKRLDFRDIAPEQIKGRLIRATIEEAEEGGDFNYIVDDLNFDNRPSTYERALAGFLHSITSRGGRVVVTTQGDLPSLIKLSFDLPPESIYPVPYLSEEEIRQMALKYGCPSGKALDSWGRIIHATTAGHPQLVHARVKSIAIEDWPTPRLDDLLIETGADEVRQEVRRRLREYLPSEDVRTLAYRLSVYTGPFKRNYALHMAQHPPAIKNIGESFDLLVGPWVESYGRGYYKLSPLLKNSAQEMFSPQDVIYLHKSATYSFFVEGVLTQTEINGILLHGLLGQTAEPLDRIAHATEDIKEDDWALIAREVEWFAHIATESEDNLFKSNPITSLTLRRLQFRVAAAEIDSEQLATKVILSWDRELLRFDEFKDIPKFFVVRLALQQMFNTTFFRLEVPIPIRTIVRNIVTTIKLGKQWEAVADTDELVRKALEAKQKLYEKLPKQEMQMLEQELGSDLDKIVDISDDVYITAVRCKSAEDVSDFIDELEAQASDAANEIWAYLGSNEFTAIMLINAAWLSEVKAESPNWERSLEVLDKVAQAALTKGVDHLVAGAYRTKAIILKEYAKDGRDAIEAINVGVQKLGYAHPALQDYLAKIYMLDERFEDAISVWKQIPPEDENRKTSWRIFSHRDALICAANLSDWSAAMEFALQGEKAARRLYHLGDVVAIGYMAERALALWKAGDLLQALNAFTEVADSLETLPDPNVDIKSHALHMKILHTIKWIGGTSNDGEKEFKPQAGIFSDPYDPEIKREKELPVRLFYPLLRTQIEQLKIKYSLRSLTLEPLISHYAKFSAYSKEIPGSNGAPNQSPFDRPMIHTLAFAALVSCIGHGKSLVLPLGRWREDARKGALLDSDLECFFDFIELTIDREDHHLRALLDKPDESGERKLIAALVLSTRDSLSPEDRFVANIFLVLNANAYAMWREETEDVVSDLVADSWRAVTEHQRFSILTPSITVPAIMSATIDTSVHGLRKAANVLLAAHRAVNVILPSEVTSRLNVIAQ